MAIKVLFHSFDGERHCPDGFAAAWALWLRFGQAVEFIPCVYQQEPPVIEDGDFVAIVDFSFPREVLLGWDARARVLVFDHHKTAQEALAGLDFAWFDMDKSGAQLAWESFHPDEPVPELIDYVADRDLWRKELPHTEEVSRALSTFPQDFEVWKTLAALPNYVDFMRRIGEPLQQAHEQAVANVAATAMWKEFGGHRVLCTQTEKYSTVSDVLNLLCKQNPETPFALNYSAQGGKIKFELRSVGNFDVSEVARQFGGGGHRNAAGCALEPSQAGEFWRPHFN